MASLCVDAMVRGHHEYQDIWTATSGERLKCAHKIGNHSDLIYLLLLFPLAFTLTLTVRIMDGQRSYCGLGRLLVFLKYLRMNIFGQTTGDTPRRGLVYQARPFSR